MKKLCGNFYNNIKIFPVFVVGGFLRVSHHGNGPLRLEDVVDWPMVVKKYQSMQGMENIGTNLSDEDENDAVNKGVSGFEKDSATIT